MKDMLTLLIVVILLGLCSLGFESLLGNTKTIRIHIDSSFCKEGLPKINRDK